MKKHILKAAILFAFFTACSLNSNAQEPSKKQEKAIVKEEKSQVKADKAQVEADKASLAADKAAGNKKAEKEDRKKEEIALSQSLWNFSEGF